MPNTISVSPAQPNKLVVNGCDLLNRTELSQSQNRELQRYIDANAHLLGLLDKPNDENEEPVDHRKYSSLGHYSTISAPAGGGNNQKYGGATGDHRSSLSLNLITASEYARRKGVSWVDNDGKTQRNRSHIPNDDQNILNTTAGLGSHPTESKTNGYGAQSGGTGNWGVNAPDNRYSSLCLANTVRPCSPSYSTSDKRRSSYDYDCDSYNRKTPSSMRRRVDSPWDGISSSHESRSRNPQRSRRTDWKGFPIPDIPLYSSLERHRDDYNRFRELHSHSQERDDTMKFYGYGDHKVSGIELNARRWTGGEIVTDPTLIKKSLKPRRIYYSPIGDGVVEADGVEMKPPPKDMTPYLSVRHERYVEQGSLGHTGRRLIEEKWSEGGGGNDGNKDNKHSGPKLPDGKLDSNRGPPYDNRNGGGPPYDDRANRCGPKGAGPDGDSGGKPLSRGDRPPGDDNSLLGSVPKSVGLSSPLGDLDDGLRSPSALSMGTDGLPREGWTKTFIVNPRELINQYGTETQTIIFDLEDHTPKTTTTIKERISQSPAPPRR